MNMPQVRDPRGHTSCDNVELPHPSMSTLDDLSGMSSRIMSAMSLYDLNQSKEESSDSLNVVPIGVWSATGTTPPVVRNLERFLLSVSLIPIRVLNWLSYT